MILAALWSNNQVVKNQDLSFLEVKNLVFWVVNKLLNDFLEVAK